MVLAHIIVTGIVQGVGFRWFVRDEALSRNLAGTVKNLSDGNVEVRVEGDRSTVEELIRALEIGNSFCRVDSCRVDWKESEGRFSKFEIMF